MPWREADFAARETGAGRRDSTHAKIFMEMRSLCGLFASFFATIERSFLLPPLHGFTPGELNADECH
jgi:hypothetical protein